MNILSLRLYKNEDDVCGDTVQTAIT